MIKRTLSKIFFSSDTNPQSRWKDDYSAQRARIAIYDLIDAENVRARAIAGAVDTDNIDLARTLGKERRSDQNNKRTSSLIEFAD